MYFRNYGHQKTWLDKCLKSPVSEDRLKSMIIIIIINRGNWAKTLFESQ